MTEYIGRKLQKKFPGFKELFQGTVTGYDAKYKRFPFHVIYDDGDEEDMSLKELQKLLIDNGSTKTTAEDDNVMLVGETHPPDAAPDPKRKQVEDDTPKVQTKRQRKSKEHAEDLQKSKPASDLSDGAVQGLLNNVHCTAEKVSCECNDIVRLEPCAGGLEGPARYCQVVIHGSTCYLAGQTAIDTKSAAGKTYKGQTAEVLELIDQKLKLAGTSKSRLLSALVHLRDIGAGASDFNAVWEQWVQQGALPVRTTVQSHMIRPDFLVEVTVTAAMPPQ